MKQTQTRKTRSFSLDCSHYGSTHNAVAGLILLGKCAKEVKYNTQKM